MKKTEEAETTVQPGVRVEHGVRLYPVKTTPGELDNVTNKHRVDHFTVKKGKAKYHLIYLAENSVGWYYAVRIGDDGLLCARRALEPLTEITCWCTT